MIAGLAPRPDAAATVRKLPAPRSQEALLPGAGAVVTEGPVSTVVVTPPALRPIAPATVAALSPDRYRLQLTIGGATLEKLRLAKDLLRHAVPSGDDAEILDRALTALLAEQAKKKFAASDTPRPTRGEAPGARHIPAEVKRAVFLRDFGRCAFTADAGRRCGERAFVEFHHVRPYAEGGPATSDNIELRCRRHNGYEWQRRARQRRESEEADAGRWGLAAPT